MTRIEIAVDFNGKDISAPTVFYGLAYIEECLFDIVATFVNDDSMMPPWDKNNQLFHTLSLVAVIVRKLWTISSNIFWINNMHIAFVIVSKLLTIRIIFFFEFHNLWRI